MRGRETVITASNLTMLRKLNTLVIFAWGDLRNLRKLDILNDGTIKIQIATERNALFLVMADVSHLGNSI